MSRHASVEPGPISLFDVQHYHRSMRDILETAIKRVLSNGQFIGGQEVRLFEERFAEYCRVEHAVGVGNGTDALVLALRAMGIGPGDEVITTAYSFVATSQAIVQVGATPRFVDIEKSGFNLDSAFLEQSLSSRTRAILVVHLFGRPAPMDSILTFAKVHGLPVIEDAAQAHGARYRGRPVGSLGDIGCFSFYPTKNLGAIGDGGAITTQSGAIARRVRLLANHDRLENEGDFGPLGTNSRLDALQAAVLNQKLNDLEERNERRRELARLYDKCLSGLPIDVSQQDDTLESAPNIYAIRVKAHQRDRLGKALHESGIETRVYYPLPIPRMTGFQRFVGQEQVFPEADAASREVLALPFHPDLECENVKWISDRVKKFFEECPE